MSIEELEQLLQHPESSTLEFKEAKNSFSLDKDLPDYCAALANGGGGKLILGVDNAGNVIGTRAFDKTYNKLQHELYNKIHINVKVDELFHPSGRVLVFDVPARPFGQRIKSTGKYTYPIRFGESLVEMDDETTRKILNETITDRSRDIINSNLIELVDPQAVEKLKVLLKNKSGRDNYLSMNQDQLLHDLSLIIDGRLTVAGLILIGKKEAIDLYLADAEIIFEWRNDSTKIPHDFRVSWRMPFLLIFDEVWNAINNRNSRYPFQEGFVQREIMAFDEKSIREAVLNAVVHRDYGMVGCSIFIKASPDYFFIESPGGFLPGITPQNIRHQRSWRNRLLAETLEKAGLVERAGQGVDDIFESCIRSGKGLPDYSQSDHHWVKLCIPTQVKDKNFVLFLEKIANERQVSFSPDEIFELEQIRQNYRVRKVENRASLLEKGVIEKNGSYYVLTHRYYDSIEQKGKYTRVSGLSRETHKELILKHLTKFKKGTIKEFMEALAISDRNYLSNLLATMKKENLISFEGTTRGFWKKLL